MLNVNRWIKYKFHNFIKLRCYWDTTNQNPIFQRNGQFRAFCKKIVMAQYGNKRNDTRGEKIIIFELKAFFLVCAEIIRNFSDFFVKN